MKRKLTTGVTVLVLGMMIALLGGGEVAAAPDYYVDIDATGANDGSAWEDAFISIQDGIDAATAGGTIWVAEGIYPEAIVLDDGIRLYGGFAGTETQLDERDWSAHVTTIDASTAGPGGGAAIHAVTMVSTVDARLDGFTVTGGYTLQEGVYTDTCGAGIFCSGLNETNAIANCTISGNRAYENGGGIYFASCSLTLTNCMVIGNVASYGGGIKSYDSTLTLMNYTISGNTAFWYDDTFAEGGGINASSSSLTLTDCTVSGNISQRAGGGLWCPETPVTLTNCIVSGNTDHAECGGIMGWPLTLTNCTIGGNTSDNGVGGIYTHNATLTNCILEGNTGLALYEGEIASDPVVTNCLFRDNPDGDWRDADTNTTKTGAAAINALPEASDCVDGDPLFQMNSSYAIEGTWSAAPDWDWDMDRTILVDSAAGFVPGALVGRLINCDTGQRMHALITANSETTVEVVGDVTAYVASGDGYAVVDYHLMSGSAAINTGTGVGAPADDFDGEGRPQALLFDIGVDEFLDTDGDTLSDWFERGYDGDPRSYNPSPGGGDLDYDAVDTDGDGALDDEEVSAGTDPLDPTSVPSPLYVDINATGANDGSSWTDAFTSIQDAIDSGAGVPAIWVAEGVYPEAIVLDDGIQLYGGFAGTETQLDERDWSAHVTTIDASAAGPGGSSAYHAVTMMSTVHARLDGFTVTGGDTLQEGVYPDTCGAGILCSGLNETNAIANCTISGNNAYENGGGMYFVSCSLTLTDCMVIGNVASYGGGINSYDSTLTLMNCIISGNTAFWYDDTFAEGGGINASSSSLTLTDCTISGNTSQRAGGGFWCPGSPLTLTNCIVSGNADHAECGGIMGWPLTLTNCTISQNTTDNGVGGIYTYDATLTNCILEGHNRRALYEADAESDPVVTNCLFYRNSWGDWYDFDTGTTKSGATAINALPEAEGCVDGSPLFQMDSEQGIWGVWETVSYDATTDRTTLTDSIPGFVPDALVGRLINCHTGTGKDKHALITSNSATSVEVVGNVTAYAASFDRYVLLDYHLMSGSPAINKGVSAGAPADDFDGEGRPQALLFDIGADEFLDTDGDTLSDWFEKGYDGDPTSYNPFPGGGDLDYNNTDTDGDGFFDAEELAGGSDPTRAGSILLTRNWVDFAYAGIEIGSLAHPYNTLGEAANRVLSGGTVRIKGDTADHTSAETPRITKALRIEAINGAVSIGR